MILDTSGMLAALDPDERRHDACREALSNAEDPLVLSPFVLAELDHLLRRKRGHMAGIALLREVEKRAYQLAPFGSGDIAVARGVIERYSGLDLGIADASLFVLADRHRTRRILTLDYRHFGTVRTLDGKPFELAPGG